MKKVISVVGPTVSGKTAFAVQLAQQAAFNNSDNSELNYSGVDIISVDSRQVYKGLEVLSGADIPAHFLAVDSSHPYNFPYFKHQELEITLHGVSIIQLTQEWSVAHFKDFATKIILNSFQNKRLPILVGGTGLYHQYLFSRDNTLYIPPNLEIRKKAQSMNLPQLQGWLSVINHQKLLQLNNSDKNNPRRLVRAIEIELGTPETKNVANLPEDIELTTYGIQPDLIHIEERIKQRVAERFEQGAVLEVERVLKICAEQELPVCSTLGVSDISDFLSNKLNQEECKKNWALHEYQYAKRQLTWFKNQTDIIWLDDLSKKQYTYQ